MLLISFLFMILFVKKFKMMKGIKFWLVWILCIWLLTSFWYCQMSQFECMYEYNLIPIQEVNTNYCIQNNLCPLESTGVEWSSLYINNIQHVSAPVINIDIPEEISWDYTGDDDSFDLSIDWYNVDTEYIEWIINIQNSKPNDQDFNNIITWLLPLLIPWFVIILFIYFIFRFIKKIF